MVYFDTAAVLLLGAWALFHIRKSVTTWSRFERIEKRLAAVEGKKLCKCGDKGCGS